MGKTILESLKTFPMFGGVNDAALTALAGLMKEENFPAGKNIIKEGADGDTMYLLLQGTCDVIKTTVFGDEYVTATLLDSYHVVFGEMALIDEAPRSATVRAKTDCSTLRIDRKTFKNYCRENPAVGCEILFAISSTLVRNLRKENENLRLVYEALIEEIEAG